MLYWITQHFAGRISGLHVFSYLTFRAILAMGTALGLSLLVGPGMIARLSRYQIGQVVRTDGPQTHLPKAGTPTMGGARSFWWSRSSRRCCGRSLPTAWCGRCSG